MMFHFAKKITCLFLVIVLSAGAAPCPAQQPGKREPKNGKKEQGGNNGTRRMVIPAIENGNIVLGKPTDHSIGANIILEKNGEAYIEYSTKPGSYTSKTPVYRSPDGEPLEISISSLSANTRYYYRLNYRLANEKTYRQSPESWFSTQRKYDAPFSFGVQGDSHPEREGKMFNPELYKQTLDSVAHRKPDFYFMMGDDFNLDRLIEKKEVSTSNVEPIYRVQRYYLGQAGKNPPLFLVNGNHEQAAKYLLDGTANNIAVIAGNTRKKYFPLPAPDPFYTGDKDTVAHIGLLKDYYAFEWGSALFVVIDPYWHSAIAVDNQPGSEEKKGKKDPWGITLGEEQYQWFKKTLETSKAKYKFVFSHHVLGTGRGGIERAKLFEWGGYGQNGEWQFDRFRPGWEMPIHQLMVKNKVTIFFQGHDHLFAKQELDGIIYQSVPNPADDTHTAFNREAYTSGVILPNSGYLHVSVSAKEVTVDYVRTFLNGNPSLPEGARTSYTYSIKK